MMPIGENKHLEGTVTSKGRVTIPVEFRRRMGITKGTRIRFGLSKNGALELRVVKDDQLHDKEALDNAVETVLDKYQVAMDYLKDK